MDGLEDVFSLVVTEWRHARLALVRVKVFFTRDDEHLPSVTYCLFHLCWLEVLELLGHFVNVFDHVHSLVASPTHRRAHFRAAMPLLAPELAHLSPDRRLRTVVALQMKLDQFGDSTSQGLDRLDHHLTVLRPLRYLSFNFVVIHRFLLPVDLTTEDVQTHLDEVSHLFPFVGAAHLALVLLGFHLPPVITDILKHLIDYVDCKWTKRNGGFLTEFN